MAPPGSNRGAGDGRVERTTSATRCGHLFHTDCLKKAFAATHQGNDNGMILEVKESLLTYLNINNSFDLDKTCSMKIFIFIATFFWFQLGLKRIVPTAKMN